jgi:hypothetical protein
MTNQANQLGTAAEARGTRSSSTLTEATAIVVLTQSASFWLANALIFWPTNLAIANDGVETLLLLSAAVLLLPALGLLVWLNARFRSRSKRGRLIGVTGASIVTAEFLFCIAKHFWG